MYRRHSRSARVPVVRARREKSPMWQLVAAAASQVHSPWTTRRAPAANLEYEPRIETHSRSFCSTHMRKAGARYFRGCHAMCSARLALKLHNLICQCMVPASDNFTTHTHTLRDEQCHDARAHESGVPCDVARSHAWSTRSASRAGHASSVGRAAAVPVPALGPSPNRRRLLVVSGKMTGGTAMASTADERSFARCVSGECCVCCCGDTTTMSSLDLRTGEDAS